jgi:hypothetical protein
MLPVLAALVPVIVMVSVLAFVVNVMPTPAVKVSVSVAESATTELCPATAIVAKLLLDEPPVTTAQVLSPLRYVVLSLVPDAPNLSTGTVPEVSCEALELPPPLTPAELALARNTALDMLVKSALARFIPPVCTPSYNLRVFVA